MQNEDIANIRRPFMDREMWNVYVKKKKVKLNIAIKDIWMIAL